MSDEGEDVPPDEAIEELMGNEEFWNEHFERERGIFTDTDRKFLWGAKTYDNKVTRSERRRSIRTRAERGLQDLSYLTMLAESDRGKLMDELGEGGARSALVSLLEFLYPALGGDVEWVEEAVAQGVSKGERRLRDDGATYYAASDVGAGVEVDVTVKRGFDVDRLERQLRSGEGHSLTPTEIGVLVREGRVDREDLVGLESGSQMRIAPETGELEPIQPYFPERRWREEAEPSEDREESPEDGGTEG